MKRIGIIGGMGPLATVDLYKKIIDLTGASKDQENISLIIDSCPDIPDRTDYILNPDVAKNPLPFLIQSANRLRNCNCDAICLSCNTAHFFIEEIQDSVDVKILRMNEIVVDALLKDYGNVRNVAVLATTGTKVAKIYEKILSKHNINSVFIDEKTQNLIMKCIYAVKANKINEFKPIFKSIMQNLEADVFIAGCTEIPILLEDYDGDKYIVDSTLELAKFIVEYAKDEQN